MMKFNGQCLSYAFWVDIYGLIGDVIEYNSGLLLAPILALPAVFNELNCTEFDFKLRMTAVLCENTRMGARLGILSWGITDLGVR